MSPGPEFPENGRMDTVIFLPGICIYLNFNIDFVIIIYICIVFFIMVAVGCPESLFMRWTVIKTLINKYNK